MKSLKKTLVLLVVLSMILSAVSPVFAFNDEIDAAYEEQANKMAAFGVFAGDENGNFNADQNITRAEMAVIIGKLTGMDSTQAEANRYVPSKFSDVNAGEWYTGWINLAAGRGIISGFPNGEFKPTENVTSAQAITMIVKALGWGVVIDNQDGTWPANYIAKAAELKLFQDAKKTNSDLVTRGNVAIYCYNALTAKTWDVAESTGDVLTSTASRTNTILAKFFSNFTNKAGDMKLVEDAKVSVSGAVTSAIGENQIKIDFEDIAVDIEADKKPRKGAEEVTYRVSDDSVVAYVPAEVANIANLAGKTVDVIFGEDNVVAYLVVTDDTVDAAYVTAFDAADEEIEIDGTVYDIADDVTVNVYNYEVGTGVAAITTLFETDLSISNPAKYMTRNVIAETILNADDEIETINFKFSAAYTKEDIEPDEDLVVAEYVVEKISSKSVATCADGTKLDLEDIEDEDDPRVIKNGKIAALTDIEVGDVITTVSYDDVYMTFVVVANTVTGEVADYVTKTNALEIDGENYIVVANPFYNENGEEDDFETAAIADVYALFEEEEVTAYLNMAGEVVAMVGESEATGTILGVVTADAELDEDNDDVEFLKVRILAEDGSEKRYSIYNKKSGKDITDAAEYGSGDGKFEVGDLDAGTVIKFEADSERTIASDDIEVIAASATTADKYDFKSNTGLLATEVAYNGVTVDEEAKTVTMTIAGESDKEVRFNSATKVLNVTEEELITSWNVLTNGDAFVANAENIWFFTKGTKIVYMVVSIDENNYGASDEQYGILLDVNKDKDEDDETIYVATVLVDGVEETYECDAAVRSYEYGSFISFKVSDGEFKEDPTVLVNYDFVDYLADLDDDAAIANIATYIDSDYLTDLGFSASTTVEAIKVDSVEVVDGETYIVFEDESTIDLAKGYIVYNLADGEEADEVSEGDYVIVANEDEDDAGYYHIVIVLN